MRGHAIWIQVLENVQIKEGGGGWGWGGVAASEKERTKTKLLFKIQRKCVNCKESGSSRLQTIL